MNRLLKISSMMFFAAGVLWVLEAIGEMFGGYVEDFNRGFDYLSEITFGTSYLALFLGAIFFVKYLKRSGNKVGWLGMTGLSLMGLSGVLLTAKALLTVVFYGILGFHSIGIIDVSFIIGVLSSLLGVTLFGISCLINKALPWWVSILFTLSIFIIFVPFVGKYLATAIYVLTAVKILNKQEVSNELANTIVIDN